MNASTAPIAETRYAENNGRYWLASYIVPLVVGAAGAVTLTLARHGSLPILANATGMLVLGTLLACASAAVVFGLLSILRKELNSYYAFQPFICGFLFFVFAAAWACAT